MSLVEPAGETSAKAGQTDSVDASVHRHSGGKPPHSTRAVPIWSAKACLRSCASGLPPRSPNRRIAQKLARWSFFEAVPFVRRAHNEP